MPLPQYCSASLVFKSPVWQCHDLVVSYWFFNKSFCINACQLSVARPRASFESGKAISVLQRILVPCYWRNSFSWVLQNYIGDLFSKTSSPPAKCVMERSCSYFLSMETTLNFEDHLTVVWLQGRGEREKGPELMNLTFPGQWFRSCLQGREIVRAAGWTEPWLLFGLPCCCAFFVTNYWMLLVGNLPLELWKASWMFCTEVCSSVLHESMQ